MNMNQSAGPKPGQKRVKKTAAQKEAVEKLRSAGVTPLQAVKAMEAEIGTRALGALARWLGNDWELGNAVQNVVRESTQARQCSTKVREALERGDMEEAAAAWQRAPNGRVRAKAGKEIPPDARRILEARRRAALAAKREQAEQEKKAEEALRKEENERALTELFGRARRGKRVVRKALATRLGAKAWATRGLPADTVEAIAHERKNSMLVTEAAQAIGIPRGRLDRWEQEGLVECTYTAPMRISGVGTVEGRVWTPIDIEAIRAKVEQLEGIDAENRRKKRAASTARRVTHGPSPETLRRREREAEYERRQRAEAVKLERSDARWKPWSAEILAEAEAAAGRDDIERVDLTDIPFVAIDPPGARDRDDAVWCERDGEGWKLLVAIADVGARVVPGTALDKAVKRRGQSVYLPQEHRPMCPPVLSEHACSLHEGESKLALVTTLHVPRDGCFESIEAMRPARVRIAEATSYAEVREQIEAKGNSPLGALGACAEVLRGTRRGANAIILETPSDTEIELDKEGRPLRSRYRTMHEAHQAIEEAMIAANVGNALWLHAHNAEGAVYRKHERPDWSEMAWAVEVALELGGRIPENADLHTKLAHVPSAKGEPSAQLDDILRKILPKALYRIRTPEPHFGLAEDVYAHTTSPIRRYADLRCQQWAHAVRGQGTAPDPEPGLDEHLNAIERESVMLEREATKRALATIACREEHRQWHPGRIASVLSWGVFAESSRIAGAQGLYHARGVRERSGLDEYIDMREWWREGEKVQMRIVHANPRTGQIDVTLKR